MTVVHILLNFIQRFNIWGLTQKVMGRMQMAGFPYFLGFMLMCLMHLLNTIKIYMNILILKMHNPNGNQKIAIKTSSNLKSKKYRKNKSHKIFLNFQNLNIKVIKFKMMIQCRWEAHQTKMMKAKMMIQCRWEAHQMKVKMMIKCRWEVHKIELMKV